MPSDNLNSTEEEDFLRTENGSAGNQGNMSFRQSN